MAPGAMAALLALASACSSDTEPAEYPIFQTGYDLIRPKTKGEDARDVMTAERLDTAGSPVLLAVTRSVDQGNTLIPISANRGTVQWTDIAGGGLLTRGGVLVGTRGLGHDLLTADAAGLRAALAAGGGTRVNRIETHLRADNVQIRRQYLCDVMPVGRDTLSFYGSTFEAVVYEERCRGEGETRVNRYWLDGGGVVRRQEVVVSDEAGVLELSLLRG